MTRLYSNLTPLKPIRRSLRSALTPAEIRLWQALKGKQLVGRKFRRQHSVGPYVLDFFCPAEMRISLRIQVVRFENRHVMENLEGVLAEISSRFSR